MGGAFPVHRYKFPRLHMEPGDFQIGPVNHQVNIQRDTAHAPQGIAEIRSQCKVGDKLAVHHIHMEVFNAGLPERLQRLRQMRKICAHHGRRQLSRHHTDHSFRLYLAACCFSYSTAGQAPSILPGRLAGKLGNDRNREMIPSRNEQKRSSLPAAKG